VNPEVKDRINWYEDTAREFLRAVLEL